MNEDDTFNRLRRISFDELFTAMQNSNVRFSAVSDPFFDAEFEFFKLRGWTELEFKREYKKFLMKDHPRSVEYVWWPRFLNEIARLERLEDERG